MSARKPWFRESLSSRSLRSNSGRDFYSPKKISPIELFLRISVTWKIITACAIFFIAAVILGALSSTDCGQSFCKYIALQPASLISKGYIWTLLTSMFMHGGISHLFVNMFVLASLGGLCEKIIGRRRFFWFYLFSGIFAGLVFVLLAVLFGSAGIGEKIFGSPLSYAVGASGAIFAITGLFVVIMPRIRFSIIFLPFFSLPAYIMVPLVLVVTWLVSSSTGLPLGNTAHFGGLIAGLLYGAYLRQKYRQKIKLISRLFS